MSTITFTLPGTPQPKGSTRAFVRGGRAITTSDNPKVAAWQEALSIVAWAARRAHGGGEVYPSSDAAIIVEAWFYFPPPIKMPPGRVYPTVRPDVDKCARALLDALTGVLYYDDGQVVDLLARKRYSVRPRVEVRVLVLTWKESPDGNDRDTHRTA